VSVNLHVQWYLEYDRQAAGRLQRKILLNLHHSGFFGLQTTPCPMCVRLTDQLRWPGPGEPVHLSLTWKGGLGNVSADAAVLQMTQLEAFFMPEQSGATRRGTWVRTTQNAEDQQRSE